MYTRMKKLINKHFYADAATAQEILDTFYAVGKLSTAEYTELSALVETVYGVQE